MSRQDHGSELQGDRHSAERRIVLRRIGATSAMLACAPIFSSEVMAQNRARDLPRTIKEAGKRLRSRSIGVTELVKACLNGAKQLGPKLNPFITLTEEEALKTAAVLESELAQGKTRGPLHGIPIVYKDNF